MIIIFLNDWRLVLSLILQSLSRSSLSPCIRRFNRFVSHAEIHDTKGVCSAKPNEKHPDHDNCDNSTISTKIGGCPPPFTGEVIDDIPVFDERDTDTYKNKADDKVHILDFFMIFRTIQN